MKSLNVGGDIGGGGNLGAVGALGGNEEGERAVGFLQVGLGDAQDIGLGDRLDAVAHEEHQAPVALRVVFAEIERDGLGIVHLQFDVLQQAGLDAFHFFLGGRLGGQAFDGLEQNLAGLVERLIELEAGGGDDEAGVVQFFHSHAGADGLLVIDQGLVEAAGGAVAEHAGEHVERGGIGVGAGGNVIERHEALGIADAAQGDGAFAVLRGLVGVGLFERAGGLGNGAEELGDQGEGLGLVELAGDGQQRVIGLVILLVERSQSVDRHIFDVGAVADGGLAVVVPGEGGLEGALA